MKASAGLKTIILLLLLSLGEIEFEKYLYFRNKKNEFRVQNKIMQYSFSKLSRMDLKKARKLTVTFFKNYSPLLFVVVKKNNSIIMAANKKPGLNNLFSATLSTIRKTDQPDYRVLKLGKDHYYFYQQRTAPYQLITVYTFRKEFIPLYLRNLLLSLALFLMFSLRSALKRSGRSRPAASEKEAEKKVQPHIQQYKELYEDNQKLSEELENLTTLREVGLAINSILNFDQMLQTIMDVVLAKMNARKIIIYLIDETDRELVGQIGREGNRIISADGLKNEKIILGSGPVGSAMELHTPVILSGSSQEGYMVTPLIAKGQLIGAIKVEDRIEERTFTENDKNSLKLLSSSVAIALNNARLYEMAITDGLTRLYVHRHFQFRLQEELQRHRRSNKPLSLIMFDIDHFKKFNDYYGHQTGDFILKELSQVSRSLFRSTDSLFRYGGEEIAVLLPETDPDNAYMLAEKLRKTVESHAFTFQNDSFKVTISQGVSTYEPVKRKELSKDKLIKMADEALYYSKNNGRNKTTFYHIPLPSEQQA
ncbi:MAG: diguanylate cyclase [bacterium]|nr:diguanylate cyclase [bacterium]